MMKVIVWVVFVACLMPTLLAEARYYDPDTGRFLQEDPVGFDAGPNPYEFVGNNPVVNTDPFGLYGSNSCVYYRKRCAESGGKYYCQQAENFCQRFPRPPDPEPAREDDFEGWSRCTRQCLQDCDVEFVKQCRIGQNPDPRTDEFTDWQHTKCHVYCYTTCAGRRNPEFKSIREQP